MKSDIAIIMNATSGSTEGGSTADTVMEKFAALGIHPQPFFCERGDQIRTCAEKAVAQGCTTLVAGGGDGTVSTVASIVAGTDLRLGVLALGTLNHFAKDAGIPLDLDAAVATIAGGRTIRVDIGEVNGHTFINNSSLGLYPHIVRHRTSEQRLGSSKWWAFFKGVLIVLGRYPLLKVTVSSNEHRVAVRTPFVFIGNNKYVIEGLNVGSRNDIDNGELSVYLTHGVGRLGLVKLILRGLFGRLRNAEDFLALTTTELVVQVRHRTLRVALDGEVMTMETPLRYRCRKLDLQLIVPEE